MIRIKETVVRDLDKEGDIVKLDTKTRVTSFLGLVIQERTITIENRIVSEESKKSMGFKLD